LQCNDNFLEMMDIKIVEGRSFYKDSDTDINKIIINETLIKEFGLENPIGKAFRLPGSSDSESDDQKLEIIGVCRDFHYASLHEPVKPIIIWKDKTVSRFVSIKINGQNEEEIVKNISLKWDQVYPDYPFDYFFLEDQYNNLYKADVKVGSVFIVFTILALFIACMGVFGLTSYTTEKRTKEIGIRKVMGADNFKIMKLISGDYIIPVIISAVISIPVSWFFIQRWLQNFSYRINLSWIVFMLSAVFAFLIALFAINTKAFFAARKNPVDSIRYE